MRTMIGDGLGKIVILSFDRGEFLLESIRDKMKELGIKNAVLLSAIATFDKAEYHRIKNCNLIPQDEFLTVEGPMELSSVNGMIVNGEPHFHMVFSDLERTYAVHLEEGTSVLYLAEVVLAEITGVEMQRIPNAHNIKQLTEVI